MAGLFADKNTPEIDRTFAEDLLSAVGKTTWVTNEDQMHAVTAASGSSPGLLLPIFRSHTTRPNRNGIR